MLRRAAHPVPVPSTVSARQITRQVRSFQRRVQTVRSNEEASGVESLPILPPNDDFDDLTMVASSSANTVTPTSAFFNYPLYAAEHDKQAVALCGSRPEKDGLGPNQTSDTSQVMDVDASQYETRDHHNLEGLEQDNHAGANQADEHQICQQERSQSPCDGDGLAQFRSPSKEGVDREHSQDLVVQDGNQAIPDSPDGAGDTYPVTTDHPATPVQADLDLSRKNVESGKKAEGSSEAPKRSRIKCPRVGGPGSNSCQGGTT